MIPIYRKREGFPMLTVSQVSQKTGVSVRTLHHYDSIGLLHPSALSDAGYRLYDDTALERLQLILLFRTLGFALKEIRRILDAPDFDRNKALEQQIELLLLQKEHIEALVDFARGIKTIGVKHMDFSAFDTKKIDEYSRQAKAVWGSTDAYREYEQKSGFRNKEEEQQLGERLMDLFAEFGAVSEKDPAGGEAQALAGKLHSFLCENYYNCTPEIFLSLADMYDGGGTMTENIDKRGGAGTAAFTANAIRVYCAKQQES